jgi:hypothetical protein
VAEEKARRFQKEKSRLSDIRLGKGTESSANPRECDVP